VELLAGHRDDKERRTLCLPVKPCSVRAGSCAKRKPADAGFIPGSYEAVYNASKAFLDSSAFALRNELKDTDVSVTCLMPGATETEFFDRAGRQDTKIGASKKDDPADVAKAGFEAMLNGEGDVVIGWMNKLQSAIANITPADMVAERHRRQAEPGSDQR
jgi:uncharacterized protein